MNFIEGLFIFTTNKIFSFLSSFNTWTWGVCAFTWSMSLHVMSNGCYPCKDHLIEDISPSAEKSEITEKHWTKNCSLFLECESNMSVLHSCLHIEKCWNFCKKVSAESDNLCRCWCFPHGIYGKKELHFITAVFFTSGNESTPTTYKTI